MVLILNSSRSNAHLVLFTVEFFFNYPVKDLYEKSFRRYRCPLHLARTKQAHPLVPSLICVVEGKGTPLSRDYCRDKFLRSRAPPNCVQFTFFPPEKAQS